MSYTYNGMGAPLTITSASGTTAYAYDYRDRLDTVTDIDSGVTEYTYVNGGRGGTTYWPNGTKTEYYHGDAVLATGYGGAVVHRRSDGYRFADIAAVGPTGSQNNLGYPTGLGVLPYNGRCGYHYDEQHRMIFESMSPSSGTIATDYDYDAVSNLTSKEKYYYTTGETENTDYEYNANDQLVSEVGPTSTTNYFYDTNGNLIEKSGPDGITTYEYDYENRLTGVTTPSHVVSYEYDPDGLRLAKVVDGNRTEFVLDSQRPYAEILEERNENGDLLARYTYGSDLISRHGAEGTLYYHKSKIGSTVHVTNADETVVGTFDYDAWGKETYASGQYVGSVMHRYAGQYYDVETGLYYMRARYYDPRVGRFVSQDNCYGGMGCQNSKNPVTLNKYLYANANPIMWTDPSGHFSLPELTVVVGIIGIVATIAIPADTPIVYLGIGQDCPNIKIKRMDVEMEGNDKDFGHYWIEIAPDESYGWWPCEQIEGLGDLIFGISGCLNGVGGSFDYGGTLMQDPHHGEGYAQGVDEMYYGAITQEGKKKGITCPIATSKIREFAWTFESDKWEWPLGPNCRTFQIEAMSYAFIQEGSVIQ